MKQRFLQFFLSLCMCFSLSQAMALTDLYYATGEDLDYLIESDNTLAIQEIEYALRKFVFFRKVEDYLFSMKAEYYEDSE